MSQNIEDGCLVQQGVGVAENGDRCRDGVHGAVDGGDLTASFRFVEYADVRIAPCQGGCIIRGTVGDKNDIQLIPRIIEGQGILYFFNDKPFFVIGCHDNGDAWPFCGDGDRARGAEYVPQADQQPYQHSISDITIENQKKAGKKKDFK
jgi:hypothetical protein